ncbi:MAG: ATP-binding protein [Pseudomonadota bacterium]
MNLSPSSTWPLLCGYNNGVRYLSAVLVVLGIAAARAALTPVLGTQAPLLPFVLGVFVCAYLGGLGPAILASLLAPAVATLWFAHWPNEASLWQWSSHVTFFLIVCLLAAWLMHALQRSHGAQLAALQKLGETTSALRDADRRKDEFLAMLAHELRNPLAPIRNVASILAGNPLDAKVIKQASALLQRQVVQLTRLVDDLLDVARITRGAIELRRTPVRIHRVIETALETVKPLLDARQQQVQYERGDPDVFVEVDELRLGQVIANLLTNASKYSASRARIWVTTEVAADVVVSVRDEGIGMDAQFLPHVFELFVQGDRTLDRSQGGLGIGLTIVMHLVQMHGGRVEARSAGLGEGSEFRVQLPRVPATAIGPASNPSASAPRGVSRRVLVVDDNVDSAESLAFLLRMAGHVVLVAFGGAAALSSLRQFPAEFVFMDIGMPGIDGYMVAHSIRTEFPSLAPRLFAMTGYGRAEDRKQALDAGFEEHLTKPVDPQRLLDIIDSGVATKPAQHSIQ